MTLAEFTETIKQSADKFDDWYREHAREAADGETWPDEQPFAEWFEQFMFFGHERDDFE